MGSISSKPFKREVRRLRAVSTAPANGGGPERITPTTAASNQQATTVKTKTSETGLGDNTNNTDSATARARAQLVSSIIVLPSDPPIWVA
jgi:hypothetical protein